MSPALLSGGWCETTTTTSKPASASCPTGNLNVAQCESSALATETCTAGTLSGGRCVITVPADKSCPAGYQHASIVNACQQAFTGRLTCPSTHPILNSRGRCISSNQGVLSTRTPTVSCPGGFWTGTGRTCVRYRAVVYSCSTGTLLGNATCRSTAPVTLSCTAGVLVGNRCLVVTSPRYSCASGTLSGTSCLIVSISRSTPALSCTAGVLVGNRCLVVTLPRYSCASGTLSGTSCLIVSPPIYVCPPGHTLNGRQCTHDHPDPPPTTTTTPPTTTTTTTAPTTTAPTTTTVPPQGDVVITSFHGRSRTGPGLIFGSLLAAPPDASCRDVHAGGEQFRVSLSKGGVVNGPDMQEMRVWVLIIDTLGGTGYIDIQVTCSPDEHDDKHAAATSGTTRFTARPEPVPGACDLPITPDGNPVSGTWITSCTSSQRGDDATPYYARRYEFTLAEAANVTVEATSDQATNLYVHGGEASSDKPLHTASSTGGPASSATISALLNPGAKPGLYTVEVANRADRTTGTFTVSVSAVNACPAGQVYMPAFKSTSDPCRPRSCGDSVFRDPYTQRCKDASYRYRYAAAIYDGAVAAADAVINDKAGETCVTRDDDPVTANELAAHMLAIPIRELEKDNPSLMDLSRWDSLFQRSDNIHLFSRGTQSGEPRAHWSPGVGPWQLDLWDPVKTWSHAKRANVNHAAAAVAEHLFTDGLCVSKDELRSQLRTWVACSGKERFGEDPDMDYCVPLGEAIYDEDGDSLRVSRVAGSDVDGGVQDRRCRWGTGGTPFDCYWYDIANAEGNATVYAEDGTQAQCSKKKSPGCSGLWYRITPLPLGFVSFTDADGTKYAAFPANDIGEPGTGTGYSETLIRGVPSDMYARQSTLGDGHGWFVDAVGSKVLYIERCPVPGSCSWHEV